MAIISSPAIDTTNAFRAISVLVGVVILFANRIVMSSAHVARQANRRLRGRGGRAAQREVSRAIVDTVGRSNADQETLRLADKAAYAGMPSLRTQPICSRFARRKCKLRAHLIKPTVCDFTTGSFSVVCPFF